MKNKKGKWEWDYNAQIIVDEYKGIILTSYVTQNPTDHFELIPSIEQLKNNLEEIYDEMPSNFQFSADNGYFTDQNTTYLEKKGQMVTYPPKNAQKKKKNTIYVKNLFKKIISTMMRKLKPIFVLWEKFYIEEEHMNTKTNKE